MKTLNLELTDSQYDNFIFVSKELGKCEPQFMFRYLLMQYMQTTVSKESILQLRRKIKLMKNTDNL